MALKFVDSVEHYDTAHLLKKWTIGGGGVVAGGRNGQGIQLVAGTPFLLKTLDYESTWIIGFAAKFSVIGPVTSLCFLGAPLVTHVGTTLAQLTVEADGTVSLYGGTTNLVGNSAGTLVLHDSTWYYFEVKVIYSGASPINIHGTVRVNGQTIIDAAGVSTGINSTQLIIQAAKSDYFGFSPQIGSGNITFDDIYVCDGTGSTNNDFIGDVKILAVYPRLDNTTQWSGGATPQFSLVNEHIPDDDTTYISSSTANQISDFFFDMISSFTGTVPGVQYLIYARKDDEGTRSIKHTVDGAPPMGVPEEFLADLYVYYHIPFDTDPIANAAWTVANFNSRKFGVKLIS